MRLPALKQLNHSLSCSSFCRYWSNKARFWKNTADYIRCIEQNTRAETDSLPEIETPEMITREWLSQLLNNLSAGVNSSETCQFLLDEILEKLPQRPPLSSETDQSI
ncbi:hypothetical protein [Aliamphritea spongicola]|nr:hypothetical protein [Aliamphritea spongicola]